jgi:F-type H+-transporting ATPase subunit delta
MVADESGDYDTWLNTLTEVARILRMPSARTVFMSPSVATAQKTAALDRLVTRVPPTLLNFLHILAERDRLDQVPGIADALRELINQKRGIITADVTTAIPLDATMERLVAGRLAEHLGRDPEKVVIRTRIDPTIIGGVVARVGDQVIDDSVRGRIERLRRTLAG